MVALVNPNRYLEPPVIPVGIEYLAHYLEREGHEVRVIDLTFADDPETALIEALSAYDPQVAGFSLRNLDTSLYFDNVFLLDTSAALIAACRRESEATVVVGGSALLAGPREIMDFLGSDYAVYGPGERAFPALLRDLERGAAPPRLLGGWSHSFDAVEVPRRGRWVDYAPYLARRGVAGFTTQVGCMARCGFCIEAGLPWKPRDPRAVVEELAILRARGCEDLHLCDCEFNQDLDTAKEFLRRMSEAELGLNWSLYMKPLPHDARLFNMLAATDAASLTLSVDSASLTAGAYGPAVLESFIALAQEQGIRVFKYTELGKAMRERALSGGTLEGGDPDYIQPVYFSLLSLEDCRELAGGDPLFRIEGLERRGNYERLS